ncbi:hypothetical protein, partial [Actinocorallia lasiicapitis]
DGRVRVPAPRDGTAPVVHSPPDLRARATDPALPVHEVRRGVLLTCGLGVALSAAGLDLAALGVTAAQPAVSRPAQWVLVLSLVYASMAVITLFGVVAAWRGYRSGVWTVIATRLVRAGVWVGFLQQVTPAAGTVAVQTAVPVLVVALLLGALRRQ